MPLPPHTISNRTPVSATDRKKRTMSEFVPTSGGSARAASSAFASRAFHNQSGTAQQRSPSPPASTYFPLLSTDAGARLRPTPDAGSHFAYSTTLRRHHSDGAALTNPGTLASAIEQETSTLWARAVGAVTGQLPTVQEGGYESVPTGEQRVTEHKGDTVSSKFCRVSAEVRCPSLRATFFWCQLDNVFQGYTCALSHNTKRFSFFHHPNPS